MFQPPDIVVQLQKRNQKHFEEAHGSPFTVPPLSNLLSTNFTGEGKSAGNILFGTWEHPKLGVQLLLHHLNVIEELEQVQEPAKITDEAFVGKLKVWKELSTTSPSGIHLCHYKALIGQHAYSYRQDDNNGEENNVKLTEL